MKTLRLSKQETQKLKFLKTIYIKRGTFEILVDWDPIEYRYHITVVNPYETVVLAK